MRALQALLRRPMVARILASTGSNAYAQATTIAIQLISLPLFLLRWDVTTYGHWLVLSAVPSYLAMADAGMVSAAGNRMTMLIGEGATAAANRVFQSAFAFVATVCGAMLVFVCAGLALWPAGSLDASSRITIGLLTATVAATLLGGLPEAVYKSTQRYALGNALANTLRLFEWAGGIAGLWWFGDFVAVALGGLLPRALFTLAMAWHSTRRSSYRWGLVDASILEIRSCAGPAIAFMAFPAANALNYQGMTLVVASVLGPAAAVVFNTYRTLARVTVQATAIFGNALWPEFSRLYGQRDLIGLGALYRRSRWLGAGLSALASIVVYLAAPTVLAHWSHGRIDFIPSLMLAAMAYAAVAGCWHVPRTLLLSTNEHGGLAWPFLVASAVCVPVAWLMARSFGLVGVVFTMLGLELAMFLLCTVLSRRVVAPAPGTGRVSVAT